MKILLTGVTGFLGSHLAKALIKSGHNVIGLKRQKSSLARLTEISDMITFEDIENGLGSIFNSHHDIKIIIHAATAYGDKDESASDVVAANITMPLQLLEWAAANGTCTFINADTFFCKASEAYSYLSCYIASKKFFLLVGNQLADAKAATFCNMRIEHMYGTGDGHQKFTPSIIKQLMDDMPEIKLTLGNQVRDFIFIDDVVNAFLHVVSAVECKSVKGVNNYEVGSGEAIKIRDFVTLAHQIIGSKSKLKFGELPYRKNEIMHSTAILDSLQALGWYPQVKIKTGIEAIVKALRQTTDSDFRKC